MERSIGQQGQYNMAGVNYNGFFKTRNVAPGNAWTCPAGVTEVLIQIVTTSAGTTVYSEPIRVAVVPNTSYTITVNSSSFVINNANTFGSLFTWTGSGFIELIWVE